MICMLMDQPADRFLGVAAAPGRALMEPDSAAALLKCEYLALRFERLADAPGPTAATAATAQQYGEMGRRLRALADALKRQRDKRR